MGVCCVMPFTVDFKLTRTGELKLSNSTYEKLLSQAMNDICLEIERNMKEPGFSVASLNKNMAKKGTGEGVTRVDPWGGAPVDTGRLRGAITSELSNPTVKLIKTPNVEYAGYVIDGTSKMAPNNFPKRAYDKAHKNNAEARAVEKAKNGLGLD